MARRSAGILAFRRRPDGIEVFLVHPGGPYWSGKDSHAWSIPKGELVDEAPLAAARREYQEETGQRIDGAFVALPPVRASGKEIHAFAIESEEPDPSRIRSNTFELQWPPGSGRVQHFPEVDRAAWFGLERAREKIHKGQQPLLDLLAAELREGGPTSGSSS